MIQAYFWRQVLKEFIKRSLASLILCLFDDILSLLNISFSDINWLALSPVWKRGCFGNWSLKTLKSVFISGHVAEFVACFCLCLVLHPERPCRLLSVLSPDQMICDNCLLSCPSFSTGVIAVVIFIIFSIVGIMSRFLYQHKQSHRTNQMKEKEYPENLDSSFRNDIDLQNTVSECKREYFIWKTAGSSHVLSLLIFGSSLSTFSYPLILVILLLCFPFIWGHTCIHHSIYPLKPAQNTRKLWPLPSSVTSLSRRKWSLKRLTRLL